MAPTELPNPIRLHRLKVWRDHLARYKAVYNPNYTTKYVAKEDDPPILFDMFSWFYDCEPNVHSAHCGSACCALGDAGLIPEFRDLGLMTVLQGQTGKVYYKSADGEVHDGSRACAMFFGIKLSEAMWIVSTLHYKSEYGRITPEAVIDRINEVIENYKAA